MAMSALHNIPMREFRPGEPVRVSGIYRALHGDAHSVPPVNADVALLVGQVFPTCDICGEKLHYELIESAPRLEDDVDFRPRCD